MGLGPWGGVKSLKNLIFGQFLKNVEKRPFLAQNRSKNRFKPIFSSIFLKIRHFQHVLGLYNVFPENLYFLTWIRLVLAWFFGFWAILAKKWDFGNLDDHHSPITVSYGVKNLLIVFSPDTLLMCKVLASWSIWVIPNSEKSTFFSRVYLAGKGWSNYLIKFNQI